MLRINVLRMEVATSEGMFGNHFRFSSKFNIIHGANSSGKSTSVNAILYALGIEELLGGKKEKTMKSPLRQELEYGTQVLRVLQSYIYLEISNGRETIVLKRSVTNASLDPNLVTVIFGAALSNPGNTYKTRDFYVHLPGSAKNKLGFHTFLAEFIGWNMPNVPAFQGGEKKLYITTLFPAFFIEQTLGWSDFLSTVPTYYGIKNVTKRSIEYLLNLDVLENEKKLSNITEEKKRIREEWKYTVENFERLAKKFSGQVVGAPRQPEIMTDTAVVDIGVPQDGKLVSINEVKGRIAAELVAARLIGTFTIGDRAGEHSSLLEQLQDRLSTLELQSRELRSMLRSESTNHQSLREQLQDIEEDLTKNKDIQKLIRLGSEMGLAVTNDLCPTCHQSIKETLLPQSIHQQPMNIEENIKFLQGQKKILEVAVSTSERLISRYTDELNAIRQETQQTRSQIRGLKTELITSDQLPSQFDIERQIELSGQLKSLEDTDIELEELRDKLTTLSSEWADALQSESKLPGDFFSESDRRKIRLLQKYFIEYVRGFGYRSNPIEQLEISEYNYFPTANGLHMKFDASASDNIRSIWAYTLALVRAAKETGGNHPSLIIFDEPGQHQVASEHIRKFFQALDQIGSDCQIIVATSLEEPMYSEATSALSFHLNQLGMKSIVPLD